MATLIIDGTLAGLNEYTKACRGNRYSGAKMKKDNEAIIKSYIFLQGIKPLKGICFAKKFILDALVASGIIEADSWRCVTGFTDEFFVDKENPRIEVSIHEIKKHD